MLQLNVTDNDSPQNGPPFSFSILKGEETSPFSIDQQGVVKTVGPLRKGQHILQVQVRIELFSYVCCVVGLQESLTAVFLELDFMDPCGSRINSQGTITDGVQQ